MSKFIDLSNKVFGELTALKRQGSDKHQNALWLCKCSCGKEVIVSSNNLKTGNTTSCGCVARKLRAKKFYKHGLHGTRIYTIWKGMKQRCLDKNSENYCNYGGRGIKICDEWVNSAENFYNWAIKCGYADTLTIDRINPNGNYEPDNCRWIKIQEQNNNRRSNRNITYKNKTQNLKQWATELGFERGAFYYLYKFLHNEEKVLEQLQEKLVAS